MGTITSTPVTALSVLTAPGGPLSSDSSLIPQSILNAANPTDLSSLSTEASALSEANALFPSTTPDFFQATGLFQSTAASITDAAFGLTPAAPATTPWSLDQLVSAYSTVTNNTGTLVNTIG